MEQNGTDVVILCGGLGTRLRTIVSDLPKCMVPIHGKPFLRILVEYLVSKGFKRFILCTGYKAEIIHSHFCDEKKVSVVFSKEKTHLGTGGGLKHCEQCLNSSTTLVVNGDSFCPLDFDALFRFHELRGCLATIVVSDTKDRTDGANVQLDNKQRVVCFSEKQSISNFLNTGVYLIRRDLLARIPENSVCSLERELFPALTSDELSGFVTSEIVYDIGTPERLEQFQRAYPGLFQRHIVKIK